MNLLIKLKAFFFSDSILWHFTFIEQLRLSSLQKNQTNCSACVRLWPLGLNTVASQASCCLSWPPLPGLWHSHLGLPSHLITAPTQGQGWVPLTLAVSSALTQRGAHSRCTATICWRMENAITQNSRDVWLQLAITRWQRTLWSRQPDSRLYRVYFFYHYYRIFIVHRAFSICFSQRLCRH